MRQFLVYILLTGVTIENYYGQMLSATVGVKKPIDCFGNSTGSVEVFPVGGTQPYTFLWDSITGGQTTSTATGLKTGNYSVTVTDNLSATVVASLSLAQPDMLMGSISTVDIKCFGKNTGTATANEIGGTTGYSYAWSNNQFTKTISGLGSGSYTVTITDANNCTATTSKSIEQPTELIPTKVVNHVSCFNGKNGSAFVSGSGGVSPYSFLWSFSSNKSSVSNLSAGNYDVTITDKNGCDTVLPVSITEPPAFTGTLISTDETCFDLDNGTASITTGGATGSHSYIWSNGNPDSSISGLKAGIYSVTVRDQDNCDTIFSTTINQPLAIEILSTKKDISCSGEKDGNISVLSSGGVGSHIYEWNTGSNQQNITNLVAGIYTITVTDSDGCDTVSSITITNPNPFSVISSTEDVTCFNKNNGTASVVVTGGTAPYSYSWSNGKTSALNSGLSVGSYTVTISDKNTCDTVITPFVVNEPTEQVVTVSAVNVYCGILGGASASPSGGTPGYSFLWNNGETSATIGGLKTGQYTVTVTDKQECKKTENVTVSEVECDRDPKPDRVFTPNGDGYNDTWYIINMDYYPTMDLHIYDRWGQKVHQQNGKYEPWDGKTLGAVLPYATYYYVLIKDTENKSLGTKTGSVTIIR